MKAVQLLRAGAGAALLGALAELAGCGGCHSEQSNFNVTPTESCLEPIFDVCDESSIKLQNNCADALVVDTSMAPPGTAAQTIAAGALVELRGDRFAQGNGHFRVPATLGTTPIVISWDVHAD